MITTKLTSKCQATIPKRIRSILGLKPSDPVCFRVEESRVWIEPANQPVLDLFGKYHHLARGRKVSIQGMKKAVAKEIAAKWSR
jgi:antitoxin PrlF